MQLRCFFGHILCCFGRRDRVYLHLNSHYFPHGHMSFFDVFFFSMVLGSIVKPPQLSVHGLWIDKLFRSSLEIKSILFIPVVYAPYPHCQDGTHYIHSPYSHYGKDVMAQWLRRWSCKSEISV